MTVMLNLRTPGSFQVTTKHVPAQTLGQFAQRASNVIQEYAERVGISRFAVEYSIVGMAQ